MSKEKLDKAYWDNRYQNKDISWDIGRVSRPIKKYIDQIKTKDISVLVPGVGSGHEVAYLLKKGFKKVTCIDFSDKMILSFDKENDNVIYIQENFFSLYGTYHLILEQTFFCALHPILRNKYVQKMAELLVPKGKLVGVLFDFETERNEPPFGGSKEEYKKLFKPYFHFNVFERCLNSEVKRKEFFINFSLKN